MVSAKRSPSNFVGEWFGHRVYPQVATGPATLRDQSQQRCPFLSTATGEQRKCIKASASSGVCTISSNSNGARQDWLVCPYRALDGALLDSATRRMFRTLVGQRSLIVSAPAVENPATRAQLLKHLAGGGAAFVYLQDKLGGEISLSPTARSPELAFDTTIVEILLSPDRETVDIGRYAILEVQTMDFHGTYKHAVKNLEDALRLHKKTFPTALQENQHWLSEGVEGPNISNVFKRTFYQILLKFRVGAHGRSAGTTLALPASVWDSWQRHLGAPPLAPQPDGTFLLTKGGSPSTGSSWIYIFDVDSVSDGKISPSPLKIVKVIGTDASSMAHFALDVVPAAALEAGGAADRVISAIHRRLSSWWPQLRLGSLAPDGS